MTNVYAEYSLNLDGTIKVVNSCITSLTGKRSYAKRVAKFVENKNIDYLKVSFFRPFYYSVYVVFKLDYNYKYAYVAGADNRLFMATSRTQTVPKNMKDDFINRAKALGYDTDKLVWVKQ